MWLYSVVTMGFFGAAFGVGLAYASRVFAVQTDPRVQELLEALPNVNCSGCGFAGCAGYAEAVAAGNAAPTLCAPGGPDVARKLCAILGVTAETDARRIAFVRCAGAATAKHDADYAGVQSCALAALVCEGYLACKNGCLLYGDCVQVGPFDAIEWQSGSVPRHRQAEMHGGLHRLHQMRQDLPGAGDQHGRPCAVIDSAACTHCGKCVEACLANAIQEFPTAA